MTEDILLLADTESRTDLGTFIGRAKRVDPDGDARLVGHGTVLAVYVSPLHGAGLPTVIGLRTFSLRDPWTGDVVTPLQALTDRLARVVAEPTLPLPPVVSTGVAWTGISPPRSGWEPVGQVRAAAASAAALAGVAEIAEGTPDGAGAAAVSRLRSVVWSRESDWSAGLTLPLPDGAAFAAEALGFLPVQEDDRVAVFRHGSWLRLTTSTGHVLVRRSLLAG